MRYLDVTLTEPAANLALDEALLETAEEQQHNGFFAETETLRIWQPSSPMVVLGRSSPYEREVHLDFCQQHHIPVLRRCSGGATIVTGPGCLMYAVVLSYRERPELRMLDQAHRYVMGQMQAAIRRLNIETEIAGTSDLIIANRKFSGNSMRCRRFGFLYHGTLICDFDLSLVSKCLKMPQRQPQYRQGRDHESFLTSLPVTTSQLAEVMVEQWNAVPQGGAILDLAGNSIEANWPVAMTRRLVDEKYLTKRWIQSVE